MKLYELCGDDRRRFSPYCWRTRMALAIKQIEVEADEFFCKELEINPLVGIVHANPKECNDPYENDQAPYKPHVVASFISDG